MPSAIKTNETELYLAKRLGKNLIRGDEKTSLLVLSDAASQMRSFLSIVTVSVDDLSTKEAQERCISNLASDPVYDSLMPYVNRLWHVSNTPAVVILFEEKDVSGIKAIDHNDADAMDMLANSRFLCGYPNAHAPNASLTWRSYTGMQLAERLHEILGIKTISKSRTKAANKGVSDFFHLWSREMLSPCLVKYDLDSVYHDIEHGVQTIIEYKRSSKPPLRKWDPYLADYTHFEGLDAFSKKIGANLWLIHQEELRSGAKDSTEILLYDIVGVSSEAKQKLASGRRRYGNYLIGSKEAMTLSDLTQRIKALETPESD